MLEKTNTMFKPWVALLVATAVLLLTVFMPFVTVKSEYRDALENSNSDIANKMIDISMIEFGGLAEETGENEDEAMSYTIVAVVFLVLAALAVVCAYFQKPVLAILTSLLTILPYFMYFFIFAIDSESVSEYGPYQWGFGFYMYYFAVIAVLVTAVWFARAKKKAKKAAV